MVRNRSQELMDIIQSVLADPAPLVEATIVIPDIIVDKLPTLSNPTQDKALPDMNHVDLWTQSSFSSTSLPQVLNGSIDPVVSSIQIKAMASSLFGPAITQNSPSPPPFAMAKSSLFAIKSPV